MLGETLKDDDQNGNVPLRIQIETIRARILSQFFCGGNGWRSGGRVVKGRSHRCTVAALQILAQVKNKRCLFSLIFVFDVDILAYFLFIPRRDGKLVKISISVDARMPIFDMNANERGMNEVCTMCRTPKNCKCKKSDVRPFRYSVL